MIREREQALASNRAQREAAERGRNEWLAVVANLESDAADTARAAENPGTEPNMPALVPGVSGISDLTRTPGSFSQRSCC